MRDRDRLTTTSPALNADNIRTPLFMAQGAKDPRVKMSESDQMVSALLERGTSKSSTWSRTTKATALTTKKTNSNSAEPRKHSLRSTCYTRQHTKIEVSM